MHHPAAPLFAGPKPSDLEVIFLQQFAKTLTKLDIFPSTGPFAPRMAKKFARISHEKHILHTGEVCNLRE